MLANVNQPNDVTVQTGNATTRLKWNPSFGSMKTTAYERAQMFVDSECIRYMTPLTPRRSGYLQSSPIAGTAIGSGHIVYNCVYARRQYYEHKSKGRWFETMKSQSLSAIREGAAYIVSGSN